MELYERVVSLAVNRKVPEGFLIRFYRQPSPLFSRCAILFDMAPIRSLTTATRFPIFVRVCVWPLFSLITSLYFNIFGAGLNVVLLCLVLALGASPLNSLRSSTRLCCFTSSALTFTHLISPSRTLCRMLLGLEINLIYVRIALVLNCISLQFSTVDKGIDPTGTGPGAGTVLLRTPM